MQKKLKRSFVVDGISFNLTLTKTLLKSFDSSSFFDSYPHIYFKAKNSRHELYATGAIFVSNHYVELSGCNEVFFFIAGAPHAEKHWQDLGKIWGFIPQKWVIHSPHGHILYEWDHPSIFTPLTCLPSMPSTTTYAQAKWGIEAIKEAIARKIVDKCIYAKIVTIEQTKALTLDVVKEHPSLGTKFFMKFHKEVIFCGITPEWLYTRYKRHITIEALAGTALKHSGLESPKLIQEFNFVKQSIMQSMHALATGSFSHTDGYLSHFNVVHKHNVYRGLLNEDTHDATLIKRLHPTGAIAGYPAKQASELSSLVETFARGFYASPLGFYTPTKAYVAIAIRSMLSVSNRAYLFAGAGIVQDSIMDEEWSELSAKLELMKSLI